MLKSHIKEELMHGEEADDVYESMAHLSTDLLMKCSLNPGCDEELYESMAAFAPAATEDLCKWLSLVLLLSCCSEMAFLILVQRGKAPDYLCCHPREARLLPQHEGCSHVS